jgi:hypothetical protein
MGAGGIQMQCKAELTLIGDFLRGLGLMKDLGAPVLRSETCGTSDFEK